MAPSPNPDPNFEVQVEVEETYKVIQNKYDEWVKTQQSASSRFGFIGRWDQVFRY